MDWAKIGKTTETLAITASSFRWPTTGRDDEIGGKLRMNGIETHIRLTRWSIGLIFFNLLMLLSMPIAWAKDIPLKVSSATFSFQAEESFVPKAFRERLGDDWEGFCEKFSQNLLVGKGPQGRGILSKASCMPIHFVKDVDELSASDTWTFQFGWKNAGLTLSIFFSGKGKKDSLLIGKIEFPKQFTPDLLFTSPEATTYVLSRIYRRLPAAWSGVFNKTDIQWQLTPLDARSMGVMSPARKVGLYALRFDVEQKSWIPTLYAVAQPLVGDDKKQFDREGGEPLELRWIITPKQAKIRLWAQEIYSPLEKEVDPSFLTVRDESKNSGSLLEGYALEGLKSTTWSVRYGTPIPKGSTVVSQASKIELIGSVGKGILDGLTFQYEFSPRQTQVEEEDTYSFTWSRMEAGWSFQLGAPQTIERFATRFKLTPKIGILNMDAYFPLNASENLEFATVAAFKVKSQFDMGGELSWELESLNYRVKLWATAHLSGYVLGGSNATKISNQRAGGDISYDLYRSAGGFRVGVMGFGYIDWVTVQQDTSPELGLNLATSTTASGASYNVTYIGAGLSVTW